VKPKSDNDLSYLIVKGMIRKLFFNETGDLPKIRRAIDERDSQAVEALVARHGRSWIETTEADSALKILSEIVDKFEASSPQVVWSRYLIAISRLFRERDTSSSAFDDGLLRHAEAIGLGPLIEAEIMEFARKREDRTMATEKAVRLIDRLETSPGAKGPNSAYALATAYFLIGNLYRFGGRYQKAKEVIGRATAIYRPTILAHQIELAHCCYSLAVCRAMEGELRIEDTSFPPLGSEFRRFSEGLIILTQAHLAWGLSKVDEAEDLTQRAANGFEEIRFAEYGRRALALRGLLGAWYRLDIGASADQAVAVSAEFAPVIRGMIGDHTASGSLKEWIAKARPSLALGMLQFAAAFGNDWSNVIGEFSLPPVLGFNDGRLEWRTEVCSSLAEADSKLREMMGIHLNVRLPLLAD
jgi:tetratricopeptide (TPR) repeat protein